jgi:HAE1 family hydrophobic/amphiphilic exporter-1
MENLIKLCVRRPVGVFIIVSFVVLVGLISLFMLKYDLYPNIQFPMIVASTTYEGVGPEEMEKLVTEPLESAVSAVPNLKKVTSTSSTGSSLIMAEFNYGTDMDFASLKVRERIDLIKRALPDDIEDPIIFKFDPAMMPIIFLGMSSPKGLAETTRLGDDKLKPRLERVPGVASVRIMGGLTREIKVLLSAEKLAFYKVAPSFITQALQGANLNLAGGKLDEGRNELTIRTIGEYQNVTELQKLQITLPSGAVIPLRELAEIKDAYHDREQLSRINGAESVMVLVMKESDANTVAVTREVRKALDRFRADFQGQASVRKVFEQAEFIESSIKNVFQNAIIGALLAVIILYLFLRSIRSTAIISVAIPVSIVITFAMIYFSKMTLNLVSMGGLALGVGMLVDNAIVVLENIQRHREDGHAATEAAVKGASEVGLAITASTLTTIVVFAPVLFVEDLTAQIFKELALTVSFSLVASLVVALTVIPTLAAKLMKLSFKQQKQLRTGADQNDFRLGKVGVIYHSLLGWAVRHRWTVILCAALTFVLGIIPFLLGIKMEFLPQIGQKEYTVEFELPLGTNLETTNQVARKIESILRREPDVEMVFAFVGSGSSMMVDSGGQSEKGTVYVMMEKGCKETIEQLMENARRKLQGMPGVKLNVKMDDNSALSSGSPIEVKIEGPEIGTLQRLADQVQTIVKSVPDTREVETSWQSGRPELQLRINRERANAFGLSVDSIAKTIQTSFKGSTATQIRLAGEEYDVLVQLRPDDRKDRVDLAKLYLFTAQGTPVQLSEVVKIVSTKGPTEISRENQSRQITVSCQIIGRDLNKVAAAIEQRIKEKLVFPNNYSYSMGGSVKNMQDSNQSLALAFLLAIVFVYMVIAVQYENLIHPLAIMGALPWRASSSTTPLSWWTISKLYAAAVYPETKRF